MIESKSLDVEAFSHVKSSQKFPYIKIMEINDTLPLVVKCLEVGDVQVIAEYKEQKRVVAKISQSAYNIDRLLRTQGSVALYKSETDVVVINSTTEYLEVI